jgi:hypothetical protein
MARERQYSYGRYPAENPPQKNLRSDIFSEVASTKDELEVTHHRQSRWLEEGP